MLFVEWRSVLGWTIALLVLALSVVASRLVRRKRALLRRSVRTVAFLLLVADGFFVCVILTSAISYSDPVFSPDRTMAARVLYTDYGGERDAEVELFRDRGFTHEIVYEARPVLTEKEIHWLNTKNLWLAGLDPLFCRSTNVVLVHCGAADSPAAPNEDIIQRLIRQLQPRT